MLFWQLHGLHDQEIRKFEDNHGDIAKEIKDVLHRLLLEQARFAKGIVIDVSAVKIRMSSILTQMDFRILDAYIVNCIMSLKDEGIRVERMASNFALHWDTPVPVGYPDPTGRNARAARTLDDILNDVLDKISAEDLIARNLLLENWREDSETETRLIVKALLGYLQELEQAPDSKEGKQ